MSQINYVEYGGSKSQQFQLFYSAKFPCVDGKTYDGPTLFIGGSESDYIPVHEHEEIKEIFPAAEFKYIDGAGHWNQQEKPEETNASLIEFLAEVSPIN